MTNKEFIDKLIEIDPFWSSKYCDEPPTLSTLYSHFRTVCDEFERLEDIEDDTVQMKMCIEHHEEQMRKVKEIADKVVEEDLKYGELRHNLLHKQEMQED